MASSETKKNFQRYSINLTGWKMEIKMGNKIGINVIVIFVRNEVDDPSSNHRLYALTLHTKALEKV